MAVNVIVGAQWGDEGKGKVVDLYTEGAHVVARYGGGANAGHTLVVGGKKLVTHLIPSGVFRKETHCVLGEGMVIDPVTLLEEIADCKSLGLLEDDTRLVVSRRAHAILPFHRMVDELRESGARAIGTTRRGIGPAYEAKVARRGIRMETLLRPDELKEQVARNLEELNPYVVQLGGKPIDAGPIVDSALAAGESLRRYMGDGRRFVHDQIAQGKNVLCEGAQGTLLDVDHGTYPFVTSSSTLAGGACTGLGIGPTAIDDVIGIAKAYTTRVGSGPFPTEQTGSVGARLRDVGGEYGATTGRPRRCGWLDVCGLRLAARLNGMTGLALTKLDVLAGLGPLQACVAYELDGAELDELPTSAHDIERARPVYRDFPGWEAPKKEVKHLDDLPKEARAYVSYLESELKVPMALVSLGPARTETLVQRKLFAA